VTPDRRFEREARRRALLDRLLRDPGDAEARQQLAALVVEGGGPRPYAGNVAFLGAVGVACAILALIALLSDRDVTAMLLAVAGLYTVVMIRRRMRS
jgi:hypothetical protein